MTVLMSLLLTQTSLGILAIATNLRADSENFSTILSIPTEMTQFLNTKY